MKHAIFHRFRLGPLVAVVASCAVVVGMAAACPFCAVESQTLSEEIQGADTAVLAKLVKEAATSDVPADSLAPENTAIGNATFEIVEVIRAPQVGAAADAQDDASRVVRSAELAAGPDPASATLAPGQHIEVVFFGEPKRDQLFFISAIAGEQLDWTTPLPLSTAAEEYVRALPTVPPSGADRLAFFQEYFEHEDPLLAQDAYDEFARAPYADVTALGPRMHHDQLVKSIQDPEVSPSRRRLYLTMLGVCGNKDDIPLLEEMIVSDYESKKPFVESLVQTGMAVGGPVALPTWIELVKQDERRKKLGLDALIACYLVLRGPEGLDLVDERLLKNPNAEYTHIYSTIMALRFHGEETEVVPRERLLASVRLLLDNPDFADQVIPDLSRWEDWSVLDRLVAMFKSSDEKGFVRQPVVTYLTVASDEPGDVGQRATAALADLEKFDPESVKRAKSLMAFGFLGRARAPGDDSNATRPETAAADPSAAIVSEGSDAEEGFAASPDDGTADATEIPDPAEYGNGDERSSIDDTTTVAPATEKDQAAATNIEANNQAAPVADSESVVNEAATTTAAVDLPPNRALIVGVPLAAAAMLMLVYWIILRSGAV